MFSSPSSKVSHITVIVLLLTFSLSLALAQEGKKCPVTMKIREKEIEVLRGEDYRIVMAVTAEKPVNVSLNVHVWNSSADLRVDPPSQENITIAEGETKNFNFTITVGENAWGRVIVKFELKSNYTPCTYTQNITVKILLSRNAILNFTKALADQNISVNISCPMFLISKNESVKKDGSFYIGKIEAPQPSTKCNLTVSLKNKLDTLYENIELERLINKTVYLVNLTFQPILEQHPITNLKVNVSFNGKHFERNVGDYLLLGLPETSLRITASAVHNGAVLGETTVLVNNTGVYEANKVLCAFAAANPCSRQINITVPVRTLKFNLYYIKEGRLKPLRSGVVKMNSVTVPVAVYDHSIKGNVEVAANESVTVPGEGLLRFYLNLSYGGHYYVCTLRLNLTGQRGEVLDCTPDIGKGSLSIKLNTSEVQICVNTTALNPLNGIATFEGLDRVLYKGRLEVQGVQYGTLKLLGINSSYTAGGGIWLWPLGFWPILQRDYVVEGTLTVDGESYRVKITCGVYTGVWSVAITVIAASAAAVAMAGRAAREAPLEAEVYDEHYDLG